MQHQRRFSDSGAPPKSIKDPGTTPPRYMFDCSDTNPDLLSHYYKMMELFFEFLCLTILL
jgi:hypothetical protein